MTAKQIIKELEKSLPDARVLVWVKNDNDQWLLLPILEVDTETPSVCLTLDYKNSI